ncbi:sensor histidine kinase [Phreatobacter oligotrophus]|uniref:histidine kinase n=1 Tax=Phreatobacter oligotrophus TaxID=1122261 RepID=A0A2T4YYS3_9HYPH|nr:sensor histidine kinase [Phreatobacter oligotrophus]PTM51836.1 two-component sensor histidine kinase [Phreatobacter oligotrophus]
MNVTAFRTVRGRLLALIVLVILPIAVITAVTAVATYRSVLSSIEASQLQTVGNFSVRTRIWYRESLRTLLTASASVAAIGQTDAQCRAVTDRLIADNIGISGIIMQVGDDTACSAGNHSSITEPVLMGLVENYRSRTRSPTWIGSEMAETSYGVTMVGDQRYMVIYAGRPRGSSRMEGLLLVNATIVDRAFDLGTLGGGTVVGLVRTPGEVVITRGAAEQDSDWLPAELPAPAQLLRWEATSRSGMTATFGMQLVAEPDLYVLARFDQQAERAAFLQFIALLLTPLVTLMVLFAVYSLAIDTNIVRWIRGIEAAALARASQQPQEAPVDPTMPDDIRRVSEAFNALVADQADRVERLNVTIGANRHLVRELHHRVKNSLQVVQSYISLARRQHGPEHRSVLAAIEAKVQVLSIAYRHALAQGEMRPVELQPFLDEVAVMLNGLLQAGRPWVSAHSAADLALVVDRAIPLGLLVVEIACHAIEERHTDHLAVEVSCTDGDHLALVVATDDRRTDAIDTKIVHGLLRQIGATRRNGPTESGVGLWDIPL